MHWAGGDKVYLFWELAKLFMQKIPVVKKKKNIVKKRMSYPD